MSKINLFSTCMRTPMPITKSSHSAIKDTFGTQPRRYDFHDELIIYQNITHPTHLNRSSTILQIG